MGIIASGTKIGIILLKFSIKLSRKEYKMAIVRFNPVKDLLNVEREFNRMFKSFDDRFGFHKREENEDVY